MTHHDAGPPECPNCGAALTETYCPQCGQKRAPLNPTFPDLAHDIVHELLHVDGRLFTSVRLLPLRPGRLFAALVTAVNRRSGHNYPQHLAFALHVHAAWFFAALLVLAFSFVGLRPLSSALQLLAFVFGVVYLVLAWRTAYATTTPGALWRAIVVVLIYVVAVTAAIGAIIVPVLLGGGA